MDPFLGEIRIFAGDFAPRNWAFCEGQLLSISQNSALFSLLGINYGGNGTVTFALPDLRGRAPMFWGNGPGLSARVIGEYSGSSTVTIDQSTMPGHKHNLSGGTIGDFGGSERLAANNLPSGDGNTPIFLSGPGAFAAMASTAFTGSGQPHNNMMPSLGVNFIIALVGIYPPRQ